MSLAAENMILLLRYVKHGWGNLERNNSSLPFPTSTASLRIETRDAGTPEPDRHVGGASV
jgi:hypothetical protein